MFFRKAARLNEPYIQRKCGNTAICFRNTTSTNSILKQYAVQNAPTFSTVVAEEQSAGRGRGEHTFFSPRGHGIYMSILLHPEKHKFAPGAITAAAGVAACEAIEKCSGNDCLIKWMNDIYIGGKKVAGILAESGSFYPQSSDIPTDFVVVGVGFNVTVPKDGYPEEFAKRADAIYKQKAPRYAREELVIAFFEGLKKWTELSENEIYSAYRKRLFVLGKTVIYEGREAIASDLCEDFRLELTFSDDGRKILLDSREISLPQ